MARITSVQTGWDGWLNPEFKPTRISWIHPGSLFMIHNNASLRADIPHRENTCTQTYISWLCGTTILVQHRQPLLFSGTSAGCKCGKGGSPLLSTLQRNTWPSPHAPNSLVLSNQSCGSLRACIDCIDFRTCVRVSVEGCDLFLFWMCVVQLCDKGVRVLALAITNTSAPASALATGAREMEVG